MKTDDEVGFDLLIDEFCAGADFSGSVEESGIGEIFGSKLSDGFFLGAGESNARAEIFEKWFKILCGAESHGAFFDGRRVGIVEFALFDF